MRFLPVWAAAVISLNCGAFSIGQSPYVFEQGLDVKVDGVTWLRTVITPFDGEYPELHYKVYTHLYDFAGALPITKGDGGKYPHHRGLFIGWKDTRAGDQLVDTWSRSTSGGKLPGFQQWIEWTRLAIYARDATQEARILWAASGGASFMEEVRTIRAFEAGAGLRALDFRSTLRSLGGTIELRGDPQHAGMHVRMAQEVAENEGETRFLLPAGARALEDDTVEGAWWVCASMPVRGKRYWVLHMTSPELPTGVPVYSIRKYGRFGAFFEPDVAEGKDFEAAFRIIWTETPLDQEACEALYRDFAAAETGEVE